MAEPAFDVPPRCKVLLLCDQVIIERDTEKVSIIGSFISVAVAKSAPQLGAFTAYLELAEGTGECRVTMEMHDLREDAIVFATEPVSVRFETRLDTLGVMVHWPSIQIDHEGAFDLIVFADGIEIERRQLQVEFYEEERG